MTAFSQHRFEAKYALAEGLKEDSQQAEPLAQLNNHRSNTLYPNKIQMLRHTARLQSKITHIIKLGHHIGSFFDKSEIAMYEQQVNCCYQEEPPKYSP